ncbi:response regulator [Alteromonadaceae bacterium M269]|nr:response regulator [Alteromonadaceae bacterium M269]
MTAVNALIIDDSEIDRYILSRQLKQIGITSIVEKDDGLAGLNFLDAYDENKLKAGDSFPPNIIFLDINMPQINGFEFLERFKALRAKHELLSCVIMMYSSSERQEDKDRAYAYEFVKDFVVKGESSAEEIAAKIKNIQ